MALTLKDLASRVKNYFVTSINRVPAVQIYNAVRQTPQYKQVQNFTGNVINQAKNNWNMPQEQRANLMRNSFANDLQNNYLTQAPAPWVSKVQDFTQNLPNMVEDRYQQSTNGLPQWQKTLLTPSHLTNKAMSYVPGIATDMLWRTPEEQNKIDQVKKFGTVDEKAHLMKQLQMETASNFAFGATSAPTVNKLDKISILKNIADGSDTLSTFQKRLGGSGEASQVIKNAGFKSAEDFWTHTHNGFNKLNNLMSETVAQTKYRQQNKQLLPKSEEFVSHVQNEIKQGSLSTVPLKNKVGIIDYLKTPENVLEKIGLGKEAKQLRVGWNNYLDELPKEIDKVTKWSERVSRPNGNQIIFKYLDGQVNQNLLTPDELKVATEIKSYLKEWAVKLKLPEESRVTNYITRIWENDAIGKDFPDDIASLIRDKVPGSVYDPFVTKRLGKDGYIEDTWRALDAYVKRATRKVNMDSVLGNIKDVSKNLEDSQFKYIKNYVDRVQMRPTDIDQMLDTSIKQIVGYKYGARPVTSLTQKARKMVYRGLLGLNPASALKNLSQGANTYAELGEKYTLKGYYEVVKELPKYIKGVDTELEKVGVLRDGFIQDRTLSATKKNVEKMDNVLFYMFNLAEKINRGASYYGAKAKAISNGMEIPQAIEYAKGVVAKTQFQFGAIDTPVAMQSDLAKTIGQFQSFTLKQGEFLGNKITNKEWAGLIRYIGASLLFIGTIGKAFGMKWSDIIPTVRIGVPPTLQAPYGAFQVATGARTEFGQEPDPNIIKRALQNKNLTKGLTAYVPGGNQILNKTIPGIVDYMKGESTAPAGGMRYPVEQSKGNLVKSALLGKYSLDEARKYYDNQRSPLSEKQSQVVRASSDKFKAYQDVLATREENAQVEKIKKLVETTGNGAFYNDKYVFIDNGETRVIDTAFQPKKPELTGSEELDKKLLSSYRSQITKREGIIKDLFEQGVMTADEAEKELLKMKELRNSVKSGGSGRNVSIKKLGSPKIAFKIKKSSVPKFKIVAPPKFIAKAKKVKNIYTASKPLKIAKTKSLKDIKIKWS